VSAPRARRAGLLLVALLAVGTLAVAACTDDDAIAHGDTTAHASSTSATSTPPARATTTVAPSACAPPAGASDPVPAAPVAGSTSDLDLTSFDGTRLRVHWFPSAGASAQDPRPTVLMGPGWGLAGDSDPDAPGILGSVSIKTLNDAGFNVLTWDPRGFGASAGTAEVDFQGAEGRDVERLISWVSTQPGVRLDRPDDPRMGMVGGSYGGGIQLVTAAIDCRVDAIVPIVAWHSLGTSLDKTGIVKQGWAGLLSQGAATASVDPTVHQSYQQGLDTGTITPEQRTWFLSRGPGDLVGRIRVPTLIVQGTIDTLFTLDEGVTNYRTLRRAGVPVSMLWYCGGHGACFTDQGDQERVSRAAVAWLRRYVDDDATVQLGPTFDTIDQHGTRFTADDLPTPSRHITASGSGKLVLTTVGGAGPATAPLHADDVVGGLALEVTPAPAMNAVDVDIPVTGGPHLVLGEPQVTLTYQGTVPDGDRPTRVFAQLVDPATGLVVGNQITPIAVRLDGRRHTTTAPLEWVSYTAAPGSALRLQIVATTVAYATPRLGGEVDISKAVVSLPVVTGMHAG
jgi:ABC-2 type transport system ATP-binding protein